MDYSETRNHITKLVGDVEWGNTEPEEESQAKATAALKLKEARMWLGVAEALSKNLDPWSNQVKKN